LYVCIIEKIINGELPDEVRSLYSDSEAFAGPKSDNDIRPLGKINLDRKIAGAILLRKNRNEIEMKSEEFSEMFSMEAILKEPRKSFIRFDLSTKRILNSILSFPMQQTRSITAAGISVCMKR